jgi:hypothetical protein
MQLSLKGPFCFCKKCLVPNLFLSLHFFDGRDTGVTPTCSSFVYGAP